MGKEKRNKLLAELKEEVTLQDRKDLEDSTEAAVRFVFRMLRILVKTKFFGFLVIPVLSAGEKSLLKWCDKIDGIKD